MWNKLPFTPGESGSEGGLVFEDEEYKDSCRITLEKCASYYAITCGVYGAMVHTAFCDEDNYTETYEAMKKDLAEFIDTETTLDEEIAFYIRFTEKY